MVFEFRFYAFYRGNRKYAEYIVGYVEEDSVDSAIERLYRNFKFSYIDDHLMGACVRKTNYPILSDEVSRKAIEYVKDDHIIVSQRYYSTFGIDENPKWTRLETGKWRNEGFSFGTRKRWGNWIHPDDEFRRFLM